MQNLPCWIEGEWLTSPEWECCEYAAFGCYSPALTTQLYKGCWSQPGQDRLVEDGMGRGDLVDHRLSSWLKVPVTGPRAEPGRRVDRTGS